MRWLRVGLAIVVVAGGGCISQPCTTQLVPGINVTIVNGVSGSRVLGTVTVTASDGSYSETSPRPLSNWSAAFERPGTYRVEVQAPGYITWVEPEVRVTEDECHVRSVDLTAQLAKAGGA